MNEAPEELRARLAGAGRVVVQLKVTPRAAATAWAGAMEDGTLKVRVAAPPEKGRANEELVRFLAREFGVAAAGVEIIAGAASTRKTVRLSGGRAGPAA
jgi:uncharacterized protein